MTKLKVIVSGPIFFEDNIFRYTITKKRKIIVESIICTKHGVSEREVIQIIKSRIRNLKKLPRAIDLPEPLRSIVYEQYQSISGMVFYDNEDYTWERFSEYDMHLLQNQVNKRGLNNYIKIFALSKEEAEENLDPSLWANIIIAYCETASYFNFAAKGRGSS